jgi:CHASE2 domain-containing sensor protein
MRRADGGGAPAQAAFVLLALALAGFAFSFTPWCGRLDMALLDREWAVLRAVAPRPAPDDIVIVGIDEASVKAVPQPLGAWNQPLGEVLVRIASARPRAIALALPLPERSMDVLGPGLDRALLVGLAAARANGPFVVALTIDPATRAARPMFGPYFAVLGRERLGIDLWAREVDGVTRRFSLLLPTEDGGFPTFDGRLCALLSGRCREGLIDFALGGPFGYVPFREVLEMRDAARVKRLFGERIVLIGEAARLGDRIAVPLNLAAWEPASGDSPGIVVHAQALRTAMLGSAPDQAPRPASVLLAVLAALLVLVRGRRALIAAGAAAVLALLAFTTFALHAGTFVPAGAALATLVAAALIRLWPRRDRARPFR